MTLAPPMPRSRVLSGAAAVKAAWDALIKDRKEAWPYEHVFPPPGSIPVHAIASVAVPAPAAKVTILTYQVPTGYKLWLKAVLQTYTNNGALAGFNPGDALWDLVVNNQAGGNAQTTFVQGLAQVPVPLGSWVYGTQWPLEKAYEFAQLDLLTSQATNVGLSQGEPNYFTSGFFGYLVPVPIGSR